MKTTTNERLCDFTSELHFPECSDPLKMFFKIDRVLKAGKMITQKDIIQGLLVEGLDHYVDEFAHAQIIV